ncbi:hypothetical protein CON82_03545 [Bacillus wiedmannii]|nr:hypothetical protein CON82_03545 [Bacillus wiedmannii]
MRLKGSGGSHGYYGTREHVQLVAQGWLCVVDRSLLKGVRDESRQVNRVYTYGTLTKQGMARAV